MGVWFTLKQKLILSNNSKSLTSCSVKSNEKDLPNNTASSYEILSIDAALLNGSGNKKMVFNSYYCLLVSG